MCIICIDYQKRLISADEAWRNAGEVVTDLRHLFEIKAMIEKDEEDK
jgi:hypothetical protein